MTSVEFVIWMRGFLAGCPLEMDGSSAPIGKWRTQLLRDQVGLVDGVPMPREKRTNLREVHRHAESEEPVSERDIYAEAGHVSCEEARQIERRYRASHFRNHRDMGEQARFSIPVDPRHDDDIRLEAFIQRVEKLEAENERLRALVAAQPERAEAYKLVAAELEAECVLGVSCTAPNRWALVVESEHPDGDTIETDEYATLIEAVDALEARMKGGPNG